MWRWLILLMVLSVSVQFSAAQEELPDILADLSLFWEQVADQPDDFSVACMPLGDPANAVIYNSEPFPLASVSKLLIFIEYARRLDAGLISMGETVNVVDLNRYNLPRTDRGAHDRFMERYPDNVSSISLWDVASEGMIQYSSNAASDYLLDRMAPINWDSLFSLLDIEDTSVPHTLTMIPLLMNNHETGLATMADIDDLSREQGENYLDLYMINDDWRQKEIAYREERGRSFPVWDVQSAIMQQHTAVGTVGDFLRIMVAVYDSDGPLPDSIKFIVRTGLRWRESAFIDANYIEFGSKLGFYSGGVLTLVAFGQPLEGEPVISVTFFRNIPQRMYSEMLREDSIGFFAHWLNLTACTQLAEALTS